MVHCILSFSGGWVRFQPKKQQKITTFWLRQGGLRPCLLFLPERSTHPHPHLSVITHIHKIQNTHIQSVHFLFIVASHLNERKVSDFGVSYYSCRTRTQLAPTKMNPPINEEETSRISMDALQNNMKQVDVAR